MSEFHGGPGPDLFKGGGEADLITGEAGDDTLVGKGGHDTIQGNKGNDLIRGGLGDDLLSGGDGDDTLQGFAGDDVVFGGEGNDRASGGEGDDTLGSGGGDDTLLGGLGQDLVREGGGSSRIDGGEGDDLIHLSGRYAATGSLVRNSDTVAAGAGRDTVLIDWSDSASPITLNLTASGELFGQTADGLLDVAGTGLEHVGAFGGSAEDTLVGSVGNDTFLGGAGLDRLYGGDGDDVLIGASGKDILKGGKGIDRWGIATPQDRTVDGFYDRSMFSAYDGHGARVGDGLGLDRISGIDGVFVEGGLANDTIWGSNGSDLLNPSLGSDSVDANEGDDTIRLSGEAEVFASDPEVAAAFADGKDTIDGDAGFDTVSFERVQVGVFVDLVEGLSRSAETATDTLIGVEAVIGGRGRDTLLGSKGGDVLSGSSGNDSLNGLVGDDQLQGGAGGDTLSGGAGEDTLAGSEGGDLIRGGADPDVLVYTSVAESTASAADTIADLENIDRIEFRAIDADVTADGDQAFVLVDKLSGHAGELVVLLEPDGDTWIGGDVDGDAEADLIIRVSGDHADFNNFAL